MMLYVIWCLMYLLVGLFIAIIGAWINSDADIDETSQFMFFVVLAWPLWIIAMVGGIILFGVIESALYFFKQIILIIRGLKTE